jgi:hypothetical protein
MNGPKNIIDIEEGETMTIYIYIILAMLAALLLAGSVAVVYHMGEKELICRYNQSEEIKK